MVRGRFRSKQGARDMTEQWSGGAVLTVSLLHVTSKTVEVKTVSKRLGKHIGASFCLPVSQWHVAF